ncbi:hypothetical protein C1H46_004743 [Malus baccata]|uniref:Uncharacterized protein n=1 Tax=Malus baccata TaxID=106549 RepID=A0A540NGJ7_MALBA|nr:hypothetical protein C1H46_004743 [Malus baccata]
MVKQTSNKPNFAVPQALQSPRRRVLGVSANNNAKVHHSRCSFPYIFLLSTFYFLNPNLNCRTHVFLLAQTPKQQQPATPTSIPKLPSSATPLKQAVYNRALGSLYEFVNMLKSDLMAIVIILGEYFQRIHWLSLQNAIHREMQRVLLYTVLWYNLTKLNHNVCSIIHS